MEAMADQEIHLSTYSIIVLLTNAVSLVCLDLANQDSLASTRIPFVCFLLTLGHFATLFLAFLPARLGKGGPLPRRVSSSKRRRLYRVLNFCLCIAYLTVTFYAFALFLGAPILTKVSETLLLSYCTALWVACPLLVFDSICGGYLSSYSVKTPIGLGLFLVSDLSFKPDSLTTRYVSLNLYAVSVGVWLGALPLELDWLSPWKTYPVTSIVGGIVGSTLAQSCVLAKPLATLIQRQLFHSKLKVK